jgi:NAD-dependent dihydropyrimidine dehydrogenase PreA subunit
VPYVITSACISSRDQSCVAVCPVDCIHDAGRMFLIDPVECIDCGACVPECPVEAIYRDDAVPTGESAFIEVNALIADGKLAAIDRRVSELVERGTS